MQLLGLGEASLSLVIIVSVGIGARVEVVERLQDSVLLEEHPALEPPWESLAELVLDESGSGETKDVVQFFEGTLLGF